MNKENLSFLQNDLKFLGFGEGKLLHEQLEQQIAGGTLTFELNTEAFYDEDYKVDAILYFKRTGPNDRYALYKYEAFLKRGDNPETERMQTFYIYKGWGITLKEAFNLLQGRAVNKDLTNMEGEKYNAWIQLNFDEVDLSSNYKVKQYRQQYGYDLGKVLEKYPLKELKTEESRALLIRALRRGNLQPVIFLKANNRMEKMFIEANPQYKTINIYSSVAKAMQRLNRRTAQTLKEERVEEQETPEDGAWKESVVAEESGEEGSDEIVNDKTVNEEAVNEEADNEGTVNEEAVNESVNEETGEIAARKQSAKKGGRK